VLLSKIGLLCLNYLFIYLFIYIFRDLAIANTNLTMLFNIFKNICVPLRIPPRI
jgi:hypothetical protein